MKLVPLSVANVSGHPGRATKRLRAAKKSTVVRFKTISRCTALVAIQIKTHT